jgi:hypothetical protein
MTLRTHGGREEDLHYEHIARFYDRFDTEGSGCWLWRGQRRGPDDPYGCLNVRGVKLNAHRIAFALAHGHCPPSESPVKVCKSCDTPLCVRHDHLYLSEIKARQADAVERGRRRPNDSVMQPAQDTAAALCRARTHCRYGHQLAGTNLYRRNNGTRDCRTCRNRVGFRSKAILAPLNAKKLQRNLNWLSSVGREFTAAEFSKAMNLQNASAQLDLLERNGLVRVSFAGDNTRWHPRRYKATDHEGPS